MIGTGSVGSLRRIEVDAPGKLQLQMTTSERETEINDTELASIIRQCVREEINFQRSGRQGTSNLLHRTRDLIANATTSVPREFNNWRSNSFVSAVSSSTATSSSTASTTDRSLAISNPQWPKRASTSTSGHSSHPWRFKKKKEDSKKPKPGKILTKQICLIDAPPYHPDSELIPDYALGDDMILVKGYCYFSTSYTESEIRTEISETLQQKFPLITPTFFNFVKRERNTIVTPVVKSSHKWDFQQVKELCGQGKLYVRLNVDAEALEISEDGEAEENIDTTVNQPERNSTTPRNNSSNSTLGASTSCSSQRNSTDVHDVIAINSESPCPSDSLLEMLPNSSVETITNTLSSCGGDINSTLDSLLNKESEVKSLPEVLEKLKLQMKSRPAKLTVDQDDIFNDAIAFYKDAAFDPEVPLRINFVDQPAIDGGGLLRQFFTDL